MEKNKAAMIARDLMNLHRLESWSFEMRTMKRYFGQCHYSKRLITLSSLLTELNPEEDVINTILHEIAHALAPKYAGHGAAWKAQALIVGCRPVRCYTDSVLKPVEKYQGECPRCHRIVRAHRRRKISCGKCSPKFDKTLLFVWTEVA